MGDVLIIGLSTLCLVLGVLGYRGAWRSWARLEEGRLEPWRWEIRNFVVGAPWFSGGVLLIYALSAMQIRDGMLAWLYFVAVGGMAIGVWTSFHIPMFLHPKWIRESLCSSGFIESDS